MSLSDCEKCWDTPCMCGYGYRDWTEAGLREHISMLQTVLAVHAPKPKLRGIIKKRCMCDPTGHGAHLDHCPLYAPTVTAGETILEMEQQLSNALDELPEAFPYPTVTEETIQDRSRKAHMSHCDFCHDGNACKEAVRAADFAESEITRHVSKLREEVNELRVTEPSDVDCDKESWAERVIP